MKPIGIDLGTTYSVAAIVRDETPAILEGESGRLTPSVVYFDNGQPLVGSVAKNMAALQPDNYVDFVKRRIGTRDPVHIDDDGREYPPEEISAVILQHIAEYAGQALGEDVNEAVITVPAYFDDAARVATKDAAEIAGINVVRLINEPTAASIAYGFGNDESGTFLAYDLGGGTFDVTVMTVNDGQIEVVATGGNRSLGGFDFDNILMTKVAEAIKVDGGPDFFDAGQLEAQLRLDCEEAKRRMTQLDNTVVRCTAEGRLFNVKILRSEFEDATAGLLQRTEDIVDEVLTEADMSWDKIDRVLLVGGSSRMPMVSAMMERLSGTRPKVDINPDEVVALGAARLANAIEKYTIADQDDSASPLGRRHRPALADPTANLVKDVTSHGMGTIAQDSSGILRNFIIIPKNSTIPCEAAEEFETLEALQRALDFKISEGDGSEVAEVEVHEIESVRLPPGLPKGSPLRITMSYDVDGTIHANLHDLTNDTNLGDFHLPRPKNMAAQEKAEKRELLLKRDTEK